MNATTGGRIAARRRGRALLYSRAALFAVVAAFAISVLGASGADTVSGRLGGDFPAFYAAGSIAGDGGWEQLYDADRQAAAQAELFPESDGDYLYFAYPPHAAAVYRPLAAMDYVLAYALHSVLMAAAVVGAMALIRPMVGVVARNFELCVTGAILCYPMLRAVTGGQNTALSVLAVAAVWRFLHDEDDVAAGLTLGILLYKPQLAVPLIGLMIIARRWRAVGAAMGGGLAVWGLGVMLMGTGWLTTWWTEVRAFAELDAEINGHNAVSWLGVAEHLFGPGSTAAWIVAGPLVVATIAAAVWIWWRPGTDLAVRFGVTVPALVLMSPHAMFYDVGLLALTAVVALDRLGRRAAPIVAACWAASWLQLGAEPLGFAPLFVVLVLGLAALAHAARNPAAEAAPVAA